MGLTLDSRDLVLPSEPPQPHLGFQSHSMPHHGPSSPGRQKIAGPMTAMYPTLKRGISDFETIAPFHVMDWRRCSSG